MGEVLEPVLETIAEVVDLIGLVIVFIGAIKFLIKFAGIEIRRLGGADCTKEIRRERQQLGGYILIALEFMIVSDVTASIVARSFETLGSLGMVVILRTAIGFFLERELRGVEAAERELDAAEDAEDSATA